MFDGKEFCFHHKSKNYKTHVKYETVHYLYNEKELNKILKMQFQK